MRKMVIIDGDDVLENCSRAVAEENGFNFTGSSMLEAAEYNSRAAHFVATAAAVLKVLRSQEINVGVGNEALNQRS